MSVALISNSIHSCISYLYVCDDILQVGSPSTGHPHRAVRVGGVVGRQDIRHCIALVAETEREFLEMENRHARRGGECRQHRLEIVNLCRHCDSFHHVPEERIAGTNLFSLDFL